MRHRWLDIAKKELCLLILLASLILAGCTQRTPDEPPDRCPVILNVHYSSGGTGGNVSAQWSPDAANILYRFSSLNHPRAWYIASLNTGSTGPLLADNRWKEDLWWAVWSPTEDVVVFTHGGLSFNDTTIYSLDVHSDNVTRLVKGGGGVPVWSPDGQQIAFRAETGLHLMNADGTNVQPLLSTAQMVAEMWHPSKPEILVLLSGDIENRPDNIGVLDVNSGHIMQLTDTEDCEYHPRWSPDGRQIAFITSDRNRDIYTMDASGGNVINLTKTMPQHEIDFSWSPDGRQIVYTRYHATSTREFSQEIYVMNADGSQQRPLTDTPNEHEFGPVWSPDGQQIAFWSTGQVGEGPDFRWWTLNVMNTDGSDRRTLVMFGPQVENEPYNADSLPQKDEKE